MYVCILFRTVVNPYYGKIKTKLNFYMLPWRSPVGKGQEYIMFILPKKIKHRLVLNNKITTMLLFLDVT